MTPHHNIIISIKNYLVENYHSVKQFFVEGGGESLGVIAFVSFISNKNFEEFVHYVWVVVCFITIMILKAVFEPVFKELIAPIWREWLKKITKKILKK